MNQYLLFLFLHIKVCLQIERFDLTYNLMGEISAQRVILDMFWGKKGSYLSCGSSLIPATAKKGKKALEWL